MSGGDAWAMVEPSMNSTMECTIDCGCTTTSMRSYGTSNSRCASITSRPLLTRVAEFVVTTQAHVPGRVGERLGGGDVGQRLAACGRGTGRRMPSARAGAPRRASPERSAWAIAECSESTGTICPGAASAGHELAADDERLLVGQRQRAPGLERREGRAESDRAGDAVEHDVGLDVRAPAARPRRRRAPCPRRRTRPPAPSSISRVAARGQPDHLESRRGWRG